ncbi:MAG: histidine phosphatase family protein [Methyloversatilis discipulorum]|uniref:histidine phosphatase family protein n=1 Tax=Methyloversatilis discipulorum TaxID=1119528 RepID=UPI0026EE4101|nr:histidine phosphatase family protein [Methyloversatilis discipulorum]MBV5287210.1 histidine phosphatase family protein [Methyloversatilis discipulorum]
MTATTRICLVRHGETTWNVDRRVQGQIDIPLNERGLLQAQATAQALLAERIDTLYGSDLGRAWVTAGRIAVPRGQPVMPEPALRERHYGAFQGLTYAEARERHPEEFHRFEARDPAAQFPGGSGESLLQFDARIWGLVETLRTRHAGYTLLLVTHGGVLDIVARRVRGLPLTGTRDFDIANCALNWIAHDANGWRIERWGDQTHLDGALDELPA